MNSAVQLNSNFLQSLFPRLLAENRFEQIAEVLSAETGSGENKWFFFKERADEIDTWINDLRSYFRALSINKDLDNDFRIENLACCAIYISSIRARSQILAPSSYRAIVNSRIWSAKKAFDYVSLITSPDIRAEALGLIRNSLPGGLLERGNSSVYSSSVDIRDADNRVLRMAELANGVPVGIQNKYIEAISQEPNEGSKSGAFEKIGKYLKTEAQKDRVIEIIDAFGNETSKRNALVKFSICLQENHRRAILEHFLSEAFESKIEKDQVDILKDVIPFLDIQMFELLSEISNKKPRQEFTEIMLLSEWWIKFSEFYPQQTYLKFQSWIQQGKKKSEYIYIAYDISKQLAAKGFPEESLLLIENLFDHYSFLGTAGQIIPFLETSRQFERIWQVASVNLEHHTDKLKILDHLTDHAKKFTPEFLQEICEFLRIDDNITDDVILIWKKILPVKKEHEIEGIIVKFKAILKKNILEEQSSKFLLLLSLVGPYLKKNGIKKYIPAFKTIPLNYFWGTEMESFIEICMLLLQNNLKEEFGTITGQLGSHPKKDFWNKALTKFSKSQLKESMPAICKISNNDACLVAIARLNSMVKPFAGKELVGIINQINDNDLRINAMLDALPAMDEFYQVLLVQNVLESVFQLYGEEKIRDTLGRIVPYIRKKCFTEEPDWEKWTKTFNYIWWLIILPCFPYKQKAIEIAYEDLRGGHFDVPVDILHTQLKAFIKYKPGLRQLIIDDIAGNKMEDVMASRFLCALYPLADSEQKQVLFDLAFKNLKSDPSKHAFLFLLSGLLIENQKQAIYEAFTATDPDGIIFNSNPEVRVNVLLVIMPWYTTQQVNRLIENEIAKTWWTEDANRVERLLASILFYPFSKYFNYINFPNTPEFFEKEIDKIENTKVAIDLYIDLLPLTEGSSRSNLLYKIKDICKKEKSSAVYLRLFESGEEDVVFSLLCNVKYEEDRREIWAGNYFGLDGIVIDLLPVCSTKFLLDFITIFNPPFKNTYVTRIVVQRLLKEGKNEMALRYLIDAELRKKDTYSGSDDNNLKFAFESLVPEIIEPTLSFMEKTADDHLRLRFYCIIFEHLTAEQKCIHITAFVKLLLERDRTDDLTKVLQQQTDVFPQVIRENILIIIMEAAIEVAREISCQLIKAATPLVLGLTSLQTIAKISRRMEKALQWWP